MAIEVSAEVLARRARRAERRAKQRVANVDRAAAMHALRLQWERENPAFPADHPAAPVPPRDPPPAATLHVGCSGWYYWHWRGAFYPSDLPGSRWFAHYASQFDTVELNAPFYSWPTLTNVNTWLRQLEGREFIYTIKVSELITHVKRFVGTKMLIRDFGHIADRLGPRMGCFLFQLPPSFHYTPARLRGILTQLDPRRRNVVEFRHRSWWNPLVYRAFRDQGVCFCSCSGPRLPDELIDSADDLYLRFHGVNRWYRHNYTADELGVWVQRIRKSSAKRIWAYFNNDRDGHAIHNARQLREMLGKTRKGGARRNDTET